MGVRGRVTSKQPPSIYKPSSLTDDGVLVIPVLGADVLRIRRELRSAMASFPEFQTGAKRLVLGSFGALGNPSSFHHPSVRKCRLRCFLEALGVFRQYLQRLCIRKKGDKMSGETTHRDIAQYKLRSDEIFGGWTAALSFSTALPGAIVSSLATEGTASAAKSAVPRRCAESRASVQASLEESVETLKERAQIALGVGKGRLLDSSGNVLDVCAPIKKARVRNGDSLTFHVSNVQIQASGFSFAAILGDGAVVTWGDTDYGGDSSAVRDQLKNVQQIQATAGGAFAAILVDRSVVTWGHPIHGGASAAVQQQLKNVQEVQASLGAFAAILGDGSVVTWGPADFGGDSSAVQGQLKTVQHIQATAGGAFAAILLDRSVVTWGHADCGGASAAVQQQLKNVQRIQASFGAFAAILGDGSVVTWGRPDTGGNSSGVQEQLKTVQHIQASSRAFAAVLEDRSVVTWGCLDSGGDCDAVRDQLKAVQQVQASGSAFAAILRDGSVVTWGEATHGGDSAVVQGQLKNVQQIQASLGAFAAILVDGSVVTWGALDFGGDSSAVQGQLKTVQHIQATPGAFAAILVDGSVVSWGAADCGGDSSAVKDFLRNEIAPGSLVIFYQEILHEVPRETLAEDSLRLFVGWRLTESEQSLQDLASQSDPGIPDTAALLDTQGVPLLPSGQWPPMYAKSHLLFWKTGLLSWSDRNVRDSCKEWTKVGTQMVPLVPRWFRSLQSLGLPLYPRYTEEEESLLRPADVWILQNRRLQLAAFTSSLRPLSTNPTLE
eukprot:s157_g7.t3